MTKAWPLVVAWCGLHCAAAGAAGLLDEVGLELRIDNNLSRAQLQRDIKGDIAVAASAAIDKGFQLSDSGRLKLSLNLSAAKFARYQGLDNLTADFGVSYRWKFGLGPYTPAARVFASASRLEYRDRARDGWLYDLGVALDKRFTPRFGMQLEYGIEMRRSDKIADRLRSTIAADVFDLTDRRIRLSGDYVVAPGYLVTAGYTLFKGDVESTTLRNLPIFLASAAIARDEVFGPDRFAYRMNGITRDMHLGVSRLIGGQSSFTVGYDYLSSTADGGVDYRSDLFRATFLHEF